MTHPFSPIGRLPRLVALLTVVGTIVCMAAGTLAQAPADGPKGRRGSSRSSAARAAPAAETKPAASASAAPAAPAKPQEVKPPEAKPAEAKPAEAKPAEAKPAEAKPAEAKPPEAKPAEAKPAGKPAEIPAKKPAEAPPEKAPAAAPEKPAKAAEPRLPRLKLVDRRGQPISLIMLAHPSMAERLKLTEEQKARIAALMTEREGALAKVPGPQRSRMIDQYDQKLAAVLSDAQREDLINNPPEPLLRFNYRFQRWIDVLEEVARQAGLSLVLPEAPPPGTLNYTDSKDYTATEAIDLVNGVLSAKGYTLIRREKMLLVVDMSEGLPEGLVPRIPIEELGSRGKFEMVRVLFPLKGRTPATVETEIKPLLGPYGKIVPLPATGQLLITDTAGIMKVISALIESMPVPPTPQPPVPAKPEPLEPVIYNLKTADPASVMKVVQMLVPNANIVPDAKNRQLTVVAGPTIQGIVKKVIEQIEKAAPPDQQPRLETYPIDESMAVQVVAALKQMVPNAIVTVDATNGRLVAWATPEEQAAIKEAAEKLAPLPTGERSRQFEVYRLTRASPSTMLSLLKSLLPNAKMAVDEGSRTLVVIAPATDQKVVKNLLEQLQPEKPGPDTPELRFYALKPHVLANAEKIASAVDHLSPRIQTTPDPTNRRLMVVAPPADQERIKQFLEEYDKKTPEPEKSTLVVYPVTGTQRKRFQSVLTRVQAQLPGMQVLEDTGPGELAIWARPDQQKVVAELLEQLKSEASSAEKHTLVSYPIQAGSATNVLDMLKKLHPNLQVFPDAEGSRVFVWAHPTDQAAVKASLEQIQAPAPPEKQPRFDAYAIYGAEPKAVVAQLQVLVPNAKLTYDAKTSRLVAFGTAAEHDLLKAAIAKLIRPGGTGIEGSPQLEVYPLTRGDGDALLTTLQNVVPQARLTLDAESKRLIAIAVPEDQKVIKRVLDQIESDKPVPNAPELRFYPLSQAPPATMVTLLQTLAPKAKITLEPGGKRLSVVASPADHVTVKAAVEQMDKSLQLEEKSKLVTYPVTPAQRKRFESMVSSLIAELPGIQVVKDTEQGELSIWAKPSQHVVVAEILEQLKSEASSAEKQPRFEAYPIYGAEPKALVAQLQTLVPDAKLTYDAKTSRLVAFGTPAEHELLKGALTKLIRPGGAGVEGSLQLEVYPLSRGDGDALLATLQNVVPQAKLTVDAESKRLIAIAVPEDQKVIKRVLDQIESDKPVPNAPELRFYPLSQAPPATMVTLLQTLAPKAKITLETGGKRLSVVASPADHVTVKAAVEQMDKMLQLEEKGKLVTYPVTPAQRKRFESMVSSLSAELPGIQVLKDTEPSELSIWAKPSQHVAIAEILDQLKRDGAAGEKLQLAVYPIRASDPDSVMTVLKNLFPNAQFTLDKRGRKIMVWTTPSEQEQIKASVETLDAGGAGGAGAVQEKLTVYPVTDADPSTVVSYLEEQVPDAKLTANAKAGTILAWARPADHQTIAKILKDLETGSGQKPQAVVYPVGNGDAKAIWQILHNLVPKATVVVDPKTGSIAATATAREHEMIRSVVEQMTKKEIAESAPRIVTYTIDSGRRGALSSLISILTEQYPAARFVPGLDRGQILAWARPAEQEKIKATISELTKQAPEGAATRLVIYNLESGGAGAVSAAASILRYMFPEAYFAPAGEPGKLIAAASPADHVRIQSVIGEVGKKEPPETAPRIVVYRAKSAAPVPGRRGAYAARAEFGAIPMLRTMFPEAQIAPGAESDQIVVLARPAEHEKIKVAIDQLSTDDPAIARRMAVYALESHGKTGAAGIIATLTQMFPEAQFSAGNEPDKVVVWARSDDHKPIETAIQQLSKKEPPEKAPKVVVYQVEAVGPITPTSAISLLTAMYPEAQFTSGQEPGTIVVLARQADHDKIKATIAEMSQKGPADKVRKMVIYTVAAGASSASPYYAAQALSGVITTLTQMFPGAKFSTGPGSEKVIAWALPEDHKRIAETIAEITKPEPPDKAFKMVVYTVPASTVTSRLSGMAGTTTGSAGVITALTAMFPSAKFSQGPDPEQVIAWARPDDHKLIAEMVNELVKPEPDEKARTMVVYTVPTTPDAAARFSPRAWAPGTGGAITALTAMFPHAKFYPGPTSDKVFAWARPDEHKEIAEVVLEMSRPEPAETARKIAVYTVPTTPGDPAGITGAVALLSAMFPDAKFSAGAEPGTVIAWARSEDHKVIAQAVEEVSKKPPPGKARTMVSYTLESSGRYSDPAGRVALIQSLRQAFSDALFFPGATRGRVVVWARPDDHATIKKAFEEMSKREPLESAPRVESYEVAVLGGTAAMTMLSTAYPEAQFSVGDDPNALIVRARPADHELIKATIEQIEATGKAGAKRTLVVYPFKAEDLLTFTDKLDPVLKRRVQLMPDEPRNRLLVWADPKYHQALKQAIDEFTREASKGGDPVSQVYRLDWADPKIVSQVVANVVPNAKVTLDQTNRSLVVHAMPEEHARIKATVQQIDNLEGSGMAPSLEIHRMKTGSPDDVLPVLEGLFLMHPGVQLSADRRNESIVAFCTPAQHKTIRTLIEQLEKGMAADSDVRLQTYPLGDMYGYDVVDTLTTLLEKQGITAELSIESRTDSLLVIARPEAHKLILETLEKLKAEERTLQIVQLEVLDPSTAQLAIGRLFGGSLSYRSTDPDVEIDEATEQLFIRATAAQHVKIRELLAKMGETGVDGDADGRTRRSRVIPIRGDVPKTVEQLQKIWPQLRSNPLQVIPAQGQPKRSSGSKSERFGKSGIQKADGPMDVPPGRLPKNEVKTAKGQEEAAADAEGWRPATRQGEAAPAPDTGAAEKPVLIIPGSRSITVTSDDPEALDQIDKLLRALTQQRGPIGRNYNVYMLQNANAIGVAAILQNFFRSQYGGRFMRANQVTIVPDERLNAIIAYAGRADRITIENLLDVLDSAEIAQPLAFDRLQFIPVENIPADRMAQVLQELYGTQVGAISVEENTNSLIVMAAPTMVEHLQQVVEKLDEAAGAESDRTVEIISLRNSSSDRVEAALNMLLGPRLQAAARTAPRTPRSAAPGAPAVAGATGQPAGPMTPTSPRARTRRGAGAAGVAGTSPAYRRSAQPTPRPSYRPAMPSGTAPSVPAPMQPTVPRARATPRAGSPATGQTSPSTAPRAAPSTMFRPTQPRPTSPAPPRTPAPPRPRGRTAAPTGQPGGGTP